MKNKIHTVTTRPDGSKWNGALVEESSALHALQPPRFHDTTMDSTTSLYIQNLLQTRDSYSRNLMHGIGDRESIQSILREIDHRLDRMSNVERGTQKPRG